VFAGEKSGDGGEDGENRRAQRDPRNPSRVTVLGAVMHALLQTFQRNFRFFHAFNCKIANRLFKIEWT
jgi:hypothetical protein